MKAAISTFTLQRFLSPTLLAAAFMISFSFSLGAQQPVSNSVDAQREAMRKLSFLAGGHAASTSAMKATCPRCRGSKAQEYAVIRAWSKEKCHAGPHH